MPDVLLGCAAQWRIVGRRLRGSLDQDPSVCMCIVEQFESAFAAITVNFNLNMSAKIGLKTGSYEMYTSHSDVYSCNSTNIGSDQISF